MYIYNYFIILLGVCVSYNTRFNTIHNTKKSKIDSRYDSRFDDYGPIYHICDIKNYKSNKSKYRVNFDGAVFGNSHKLGVGVVIRNDLREVMASLSEKIVMPLSVEVLEMLVARRAAIFAKELSFKHVWFEGDAEG